MLTKDRNLRSIDWSKKHTSKSREIIPLIASRFDLQCKRSVRILSQWTLGFRQLKQ
jgi:hypothetical protein